MWRRARLRRLDHPHLTVVAGQPLGQRGAGLLVTIEPWVGGRIFERTPRASSTNGAR